MDGWLQFGWLGDARRPSGGDRLIRALGDLLAGLVGEQIEGAGGTWSAEEENTFKNPIREQYEHQGHPYYASARLWDDGMIDPAQSRHVLGLSLAIAMNAPIDEMSFGVFRM